jgi:release factor glutamine methyltransferase
MPTFIEKAASRWLQETADSIKPFSDAPLLEASLLVAMLCGTSHKAILAHLDTLLVVDEDRLHAMIARRRAGEPLAYIIGTCEFFGLELMIVPPLLVPRPETEILVEHTLRWMGDRACRVLDVGTGTGAIAVALGYHAPRITLFASDISTVAVNTAKRNAERFGVACRLLVGNWLECLAPRPYFDVIVSNPPYVSEEEYASLSRTIRDYEDPLALRAGADGLACFRRLIPQAYERLKPGGLLALEIGESQLDDVRRLLHETRFDSVHGYNDLRNVPRCVFAIK